MPTPLLRESATHWVWIVTALLLLSGRAGWADEEASTAVEQAAAMTTLATKAVDASTERLANATAFKPAFKPALEELKKFADSWATAAAAWQKAAQEWAKVPAKKATAEAAKKAAGQAMNAYDAQLKAVQAATSTDKTTWDSDYVAKHFSLVAGAIVLNPFKIKSVDTDANPNTTELELDKGNTDAKLLLEGGFRRRWAWENWRTGADRALYRELKAVRDHLRTERGKPVDQQNSKQITQWEADQANLEQKIRTARLLYSGDEEPGVSIGGWPQPRDTECTWQQTRDAGASNPFGAAGRRCWWNGLLNTASVLLFPDNYAVRLGFALGSSKASGAAGVAGGGDFHIETALGFDWIEALYPADLEPLRIGFGPEIYASFSNDTEQDDTHQRLLLGGALSAGLPLGDEEERLAEIVVRMGWVSVEVPEFLNGTERLVVTKNRRVDFDQEKGFGVDVEMNIPITKEWGYLFLRVTSNNGFNPNPWTTTIGYTLPINNLTEMIRP